MSAYTVTALRAGLYLRGFAERYVQRCPAAKLDEYPHSSPKTTITGQKATRLLSVAIRRWKEYALQFGSAQDKHSRSRKNKKMGNVPLSIRPRTIPQDPTMHDKIKTPFGRHVTISDVKTFVLDRALLNRDDADSVRVVGQLERGGLEYSPLYGILRLGRVGSNGSLIIYALGTF